MRSVCVAFALQFVFLNQLFNPSFFACTSRPITLAFLVARPTSNATSSLGLEAATVASVSNAKSRSSFTTRTSRCVGISHPTIAQQGHIQILDSIPTTGVGFVSPVGRSTGGINKTSDGGSHISQNIDSRSQSRMMLLVCPRWNWMWKQVIASIVRPLLNSKEPCRSWMPPNIFHGTVLEGSRPLSEYNIQQATIDQDTIESIQQASIDRDTTAIKRPDDLSIRRLGCHYCYLPSSPIDCDNGGCLCETCAANQSIPGEFESTDYGTDVAPRNKSHSLDGFANVAPASSMSDFYF